MAQTSPQGPSNTMGADGKQQHLYKVLVIGDYAVGKTSLIKRYCEGYFTPNYKLTIGVDFAVKSVEWDENTNVSLQLWDIAGHERFGTMTRVYYKYAIAAIIVFDLSRPATFEAVTKWREDVNSKVVLGNQEPIPVLLLANKCDLPGVVIDTEQLDRFVKENNFIGWFPTSAQNNTNVDDAMKYLIVKILEVAKTNAPTKPAEDSISISADAQVSSDTEKKKDNCCPF
eukprot:TRINITY_DN3320_c0_g3_i1.p1 TRINITY_DN3320_c0_g3~~TRINITY_DN3320_c0_g3_i1.p1  ORF type:complete len:228 (-),score=36.03 TRINITY_DN3320_c0_g3_i1:158-841(-)